MVTNSLILILHNNSKYIVLQNQHEILMFQETTLRHTLYLALKITLMRLFTPKLDLTKA